MFELLSHVGIHNARELASYGANLLLCTVFVAALFQTFGPRDEQR